MRHAAVRGFYCFHQRDYQSPAPVLIGSIETFAGGNASATVVAPYTTWYEKLGVLLGRAPCTDVLEQSCPTYKVTSENEELNS